MLPTLKAQGVGARTENPCLLSLIRLQTQNADEVRNLAAQPTTGLVIG